MPQKIFNRLLASLKSEDLSILRQLREVPLIQGQLLLERGERVDAVHFPQSGMISLIVEMPEDRTVEVGMIGSEGAVGLAVGLGVANFLDHRAGSGHRHLALHSGVSISQRRGAKPASA